MSVFTLELSEWQSGKIMQYRAKIMLNDKIAQFLTDFDEILTKRQAIPKFKLSLFSLKSVKI